MQGARFAKWRAVIKIDDEGCPSTTGGKCGLGKALRIHAASEPRQRAGCDTVGRTGGCCTGSKPLLRRGN